MNKKPHYLRVHDPRASTIAETLQQPFIMPTLSVVTLETERWNSWLEMGEYFAD